MKNRPLLITPGEPAGIGAEIALKAWQSGITDICLIDQPAHIAQMAASLGITAKLREISDPASFDSSSQDLHVIPISWKAAPVAGTPDPANAPQVIDAIRILRHQSRSPLSDKSPLRDIRQRSRS
jgi:4-hydroxythreonine-4-phosphate dehydrogenase